MERDNWVQKGPAGTQPRELQVLLVGVWGEVSVACYELRGKSGNILGAAVSGTTFWYCVPTIQLRPSP